MQKKSSGSFKNVIDKMFTNYIYIYIYIYFCVCVCVCKQDMVLNDLQWLICLKTKPNHSLIAGNIVSEF